MQKLQIMYTCLVCGKCFYCADGEMITLQEFLENDLVTGDYKNEYSNGFCIDCVAGIHFKEV